MRGKKSHFEKKKILKLNIKKTHFLKKMQTKFFYKNIKAPDMCLSSFESWSRIESLGTALK